MRQDNSPSTMDQKIDLEIMHAVNLDVPDQVYSSTKQKTSLPNQGDGSASAKPPKSEPVDSVQPTPTPATVVVGVSSEETAVGPDDEIHPSSAQLPNATSDNITKDISGQEMENETIQDHATESKEEKARDPDSDDDDESPIILMGEVIHSTYGIKKPLDVRRKIAEKRIVQNMSYARLLEDRIQYLESEVEKLVLGESVVKKPDDVHKQSATLLELKRYSLAGWSDHQKARRAYKRYKKGSEPPRYAISVVLSDTGTAKKLDINKSLNEAPPRPSHDDSETSEAKPSASSITEVQRPRVYRVRISSGPLLAMLEEISGQNFGSYDHQTFLSPFKLFTTFEGSIRERANKLRDKFCAIDASNKRQNDSGDQKAANSEMLPTKPDDQHADQPKQTSIETPLDSDVNNGETAQPELEQLSESRQCLAEVELLLELFDVDLKSVFEKRQQLERAKTDMIAFGDLWHLFKTGENVVLSEGQSQVYRVLNAVGGRPYLCLRRDAGMPNAEEVYGDREVILRHLTAYDQEPMPDNPFVIHAFYYDFNGKMFGPVGKTFKIAPYEGDRLISSLPCYPVKYIKKSATMIDIQAFINQGKRFVKLAHVNHIAHKQYDGLTMDQIKEEIDSEVIIDFSMAFMRHPAWEPTLSLGPQLQGDMRETKEVVGLRETVDGKELDGKCDRGVCCANDAIHADYDMQTAQPSAFAVDKNSHLEAFSVGEDLTDDDYMLFPCRVHGFVLRTRRWATLHVNFVRDVVQREANFDSLVLPQGHKDTLLALVKTHAQGTKPAEGADPSVSQNRRPTQSIDLVRGKGKGLIILLHGEPGVGKTSTAECVAEYTHRPLFSITCGDIGQTADDVEKRLEQNFQLAHKWGCVLLLDEADVFLARRTRTDLQRNAIVSVFLRVLEYYSGILFLTTNRIGIFDPAFRSRIHMSLFYPRLSRKATEAIWQMNMDRTKELWDDKMKFEDKHVKQILAYAKDHYRELRRSKTTWNGRQIRNAFQTATAIAEYEVHETAVKHNLDPVPTPVLEKRHFEKVAQASSHFDRYLKETWGEYAEDLARNAQERRDDLGLSDTEFLAPARNTRSSKGKKAREDVSEDDSDTSGDD